MCGITGILRNRPIASDEIQTLTSYVSHRGPNGIHCWRSADATAALGHSRLAIIDLSEAADQPMGTGDGRFQIVYNGEIFNYKELRAELATAGYPFRTSSDTEVVLAAYVTWGEAALHRFNGMWAFAVYDTVDSTLFLARDRFGIKPLFWLQTNEELVFASEIQAIGRFLGARVTGNGRFLERLIHYDIAVYAESETHLEGVRSLLPGWTCRVESDLCIKQKRWYQLQRVTVPQRFKDQAVEFRSILTDACRIRLRSDVPVATCLSGGVDSGTIVSILANSMHGAQDELKSFTHKSFTAAFPGWDLDESAAARMLSREKGMQLDLHTVDCPDPEELERAMRACDGPMPALSFYPIWKLYEHIKRSGISVTLDGQGADEMFGGYYLGYAAMKGALEARRPLWCADLFRTYRALGGETALRASRDLASVLKERRTALSQRIKSPAKRVLAAIGAYSVQARRSPAPDFLPEAVATDDPDVGNSLARALWKQFFVSPLPFLLQKYDRCSMASGVECRMPFMDYRVVEYAYSLPLSSRIGGGYTKRVLREAVKGILPDSIRTNRKKIGFNAPFSSWIHGPLRNWVLDIMTSRSFSESPYFDGKEIRSVFESSQSRAEHELPEWVLWPCLHNAWWHLNR